MLNKTIRELHTAIQEKEVTPSQLVAESYRQIADHDGVLNTVITTNEPAATAQAQQLDGREATHLLHGIPIGIKDNIITKDLRTTCGSKMLENFNPVYNATVIEKLVAAGAVPVAKLNMDEFAMGSSNETSYYGAVRNPWNTDYVPGGSSGGSAAAVAAGLVPVALGSDTGGSVRQPAALTGIVGMKPTYGRISRYGLVAFASSLDQIGVFSKTVEDNAIVLETIAGVDPMDNTSSPLEVPNYTDALGKSIAGMRLGVPAEYMSDMVDPEVKAAIEAAIEVYRSLGATVEEVHMPHLKYVVPAYYIIAPSEASSNLSRFDGMRYGHRSAEATDIESIFRKSRAEGFGEEVKRRILIGTYCLSAGHFDAYYMKALKLRTVIKEDFDAIFKEFDAIIGPTTTAPAFKVGENKEKTIDMYMNDILTIPANLVGLPAMSIPAGFSQAGLPIGLQLAGKHFGEATLYQLAHAFEQATDHHKKRPTL